MDDLIAAGVSLADVGIDRYLGNPRGSGRYADKVYRSPTALVADVVYGFLAERYLHFVTSKSTPLIISQVTWFIHTACEVRCAYCEAGAWVACQFHP